MNDSAVLSNLAILLARLHAEAPIRRLLHLCDVQTVAAMSTY
jgi:hypothetical protein